MKTLFKRILLVLSIFILSLCDTQAKTLYSCFLSQDYNMETGDVSNQVSDNSLCKIYIESNKLYLGSKTYSMYNKAVSNSGFITITHYDAIDGEGQRCKIKLIHDSSADWVTRNTIIIWYDEISPIAKWYQSRDPIQR